jgi:hypothetical protein
MKLNRNDLRKILHDFNSISNRLMQADYNDYNDVLAKFIRFLANTEVINDYIIDCGKCSWKIDEAYKEVATSFGRKIFPLGDTDREEVANIFALLKYAVTNKIRINLTVGLSYSNSNNFQDMTKAFNDRVVYVLIQHIEDYLINIGIDMGLDDKNEYNITVSNGQAIFAKDSSTVTATNNVTGLNDSELEKLIEGVASAAKDSSLAEDDLEQVNTSLSIIAEELKSTKPRKGFLNTAVSGIKVVKGSAEFGAAVAAITQFLQPILSSL